jgi:hypothetical protein
VIEIREPRWAEDLTVSVAVGKGRQEWRGGGPKYPVLILFLLLGALFKRSVALNGAPLLGAAKRTLDSEDRSEMIGQEERKGEKMGRHNGPVAPATTHRD